MAHAGLPRFACWRHTGAREGFEAVFFDRRRDGGLRIEGHTAASEEGDAFAVRYAVDVDARWCTRFARVEGRSAQVSAVVTLESDGAGRWRVDGRDAGGLDGCIDVDLEASVVTNALPVHRLRLAPGDQADVPAAYVRALTLEVGRLDQRYRRVDEGAGKGRSYDYEAPAFDFGCRLEYDAAGLLLDYPGIARRAGV